MGQLKRLIIHCTATPEGRPVSRKDIEQWHLVERGWRKVGYSDMIHLDGRIENLIPHDYDDCVDSWEMSNGAKGFNGTSRHVVYVGGGKSKGIDTRTEAQKLALELYVKAFKHDHPKAKVIGHNEVNKYKDCPSFDVQAWLKTINVFR